MSHDEIVDKSVNFPLDKSLRTLTNQMTGVYFLINKRKKVIYVGKSINSIGARMRKYRHDEQFTRAYWHETDPYQADIYEGVYIRALKTKLNGSYHKFTKLPLCISLCYFEYQSLNDMSQAEHDAIDIDIDKAIMSL